MKATLRMLKENFMSSSELTPQFEAFHNLFKEEFTKYLKQTFNATRIDIRRGHFACCGFFELPSENIYYFSLGDVRWDEKEMLLRTAKSFTDYVGGSNGFVTLEDVFSFDRDMQRIVKREKKKKEFMGEYPDYWKVQLYVLL